MTVFITNLRSTPDFLPILLPPVVALALRGAGPGAGVSDFPANAGFVNSFELLRENLLSSHVSFTSFRLH